MAVVPRAAATVVLLRDGQDGLEAYLQLRPLGDGVRGWAVGVSRGAGGRGGPRPGGRRALGRATGDGVG